ncbi:MAG: DUF2726 domain-containing protein [Bacillota bacterium]|nr:DUF2726 domain-containing protein [Bacillota bacterium]
MQPLLILIGILLVALVALFFSNPSKGKYKDPTENIEPWPYTRKDRMINDTEYLFYQALCNYIGDRAVVIPKTRALDLVDLPAKDKYKELYHFRAVKKYTDFVICEPVQLWTICAVLFDDSSFDEDAKKDHLGRDICRILTSADIPFVRIAAEEYYEDSDFKAIDEVLNDFYADERKTVGK